MRNWSYTSTSLVNGNNHPYPLHSISYKLYQVNQSYYNYYTHVEEAASPLTNYNYTHPLQVVEDRNETPVSPGDAPVFCCRVILPRHKPKEGACMSPSGDFGVVVNVSW
jgi:hypothetical protein